MVEIPAPTHVQPVFWQSIEIPAGNLVVDRNWQGDCHAVRFGRYPYDPDWKSASKIGSRISFIAP